VVRPVLYSCGRGAKSTISLPGTHPSKNIPIDSVGIVGAVQVTSDLKKTRQKVRRQAGPRSNSVRTKSVVCGNLARWLSSLLFGRRCLELCSINRFFPSMLTI
jgi:hypothetical protein